MLKIKNLTKEALGVSTWRPMHSSRSYPSQSTQNPAFILKTTIPQQWGLLKQIPVLTRRASTFHTMSTRASEGFTLRPATHVDCDAVKNIDRKVGSGFDTLLYCYHQNISMATRFNQIVEKSGQVVGYGCLHVIDDGDLCILRHGRIAVEHRGKVLSKLVLSLLDAALSEYPHLQRMSFSALDEEDVKNKIAMRPLWKWIMQRPVESFVTNTDELTTLCDSEMFHRLEEKINTDTISGFPKRESLKLLTEEICHLDFAPSTPMIGFQPSGWKASTLGNQLQITDLFVSRCLQTDDIKAFSFMTITRGDYGVETNSEVYCDSSAGSEDLVIAHLVHYMREMSLLLSATKVVCCFHHPAGVSRGRVKHMLNKQLGIPSNVDKNWTASLYECSVVDSLKLKWKHTTTGHFML